MMNGKDIRNISLDSRGGVPAAIVLRSIDTKIINEYNLAKF